MAAPPPSQLDAPQVLRYAFDESTGTLRTTASAVLTPTGSVNVIIASSADSVALGSIDGSLFASFTVVGSSTGLDVNVLNTTAVSGNIAVTSIVPIGVSGTVSVSGSSLTSTIANPIAVSSIVPVSVTGTISVSGSAITSSISGTANVNVVNQLAISSSIPISITGTTAISGSVSSNITNPLAISSSVPISITGTVSVSGSSITSTISNVSYDYGTSASAIRTASQIGNSTGAADFNAGNSSAQTLRTVIATNQSAIPVSQSGSWTVTANIANQLAISSIVPISVTGTVSVSGSALTASIAGTANVNVTNPLSITSIVPISVTGITAVSGNISVTSIVPVGVSGTVSVSGNALTSFIAGTANVNVTNQLAISSSVPISITGTTAVSGNIAVTSIVPISVTGTVSVSGSALTANLANVVGSATGDGAAVSSVLVGGLYNPSIPTLTSGQQTGISLDEKGILLVKPDFAGYTLQSKVYSTSTTQVNIATTTETPLFLLKNPSGSTILVRLFKLVFLSPDGTAGHTLTFKVYAMPTITANGTALTTINNRVKTAPTAGTAQAFRSPTISSNGTLMFSRLKFGQTSDISFDVDNQIVIEANSHVLITAQGSVNNILMEVDAWWAEV